MSEQQRPTQEELLALQPTDEETAEIEELEELQAIAWRYLQDPEEAERVRPDARNTLSFREYMGLYAALTFRETGLSETIGAAMEENLYALCQFVQTKFDAHNLPMLPGNEQDAAAQPPPAEDEATKQADDVTGAAGTHESLIREKDREIERLTKALEETRSALLQAQERLGRTRAELALQVLQEPEETLQEDEAPPPAAPAEAARRWPWRRQHEDPP